MRGRLLLLQLPPPAGPGLTCQLDALVVELSVGPLALKQTLGVGATLKQGLQDGQHDSCRQLSPRQDHSKLQP